MMKEDEQMEVKKQGKKSAFVRWFQKLSMRRRIELIVASILTCFLILGMPVYGWFARQRAIAELQMIKSPDLLYITAANVEAAINLELGSIDVEKDGVTHKLVPFCVAGEYVTSFTLQLAHTSNTPFTYEIFEGTAYTSESGAQATGADYVEYTVKNDFDGISLSSTDLGRETLTTGQSLYIAKGSSLNASSGSYNGRYLNMNTDNRTATTKYLEECYGNEDGNYTNYTNYELALYWQCTGIPAVEDPLNHGILFFKTFILDVSWDDSLTNDKETDIVYIMAFSGN